MAEAHAYTTDRRAAPREPTLERRGWACMCSTSWLSIAPLRPSRSLPPCRSRLGRQRCARWRERVAMSRQRSGSWVASVRKEAHMQFDHGLHPDGGVRPVDALVDGLLQDGTDRSDRIGVGCTRRAAAHSSGRARRSPTRRAGAYRGRSSDVDACARYRRGGSPYTPATVACAYAAVDAGPSLYHTNSCGQGHGPHT